MPDPLQVVTRPASGAPAGAIVLIHGFGANEHDLFPLLDVLDPERRLLGVCPRGPYRHPLGGAAWYEIGYVDSAEGHESVTRLSALVDGLEVGRDRVVVGGFSQGAVLTYAVGLRSGTPPPAGILAFSGFLPPPAVFQLDAEIARGLPAVVAHGTYDDIIPVTQGRAARDWLEAAGADVEYHESPMGHGIDPRLFAGLQAWLARVIP